MDLLERARAGFPAATESTYVNVADSSPMSIVVRKAIERYLDDHQSHSRQSPDGKRHWRQKVEQVRCKVASIMNARAHDIAFTKSTSDGLNMVAGAIEWRPGDNVVISPGFEHPNNIVPWLHLRRLGVEVVSMPLRGSVVSVDQFEGAIDDRTRVVAVSAVSYFTGGRVDLEQLASLCMSKGVRLVVDAAQSLGVMAFDVSRIPVWAASATTGKALLGLFGLGVLYCRDASTLLPMSLSVVGVKTSQRSADAQSELLFADELADGARRFELGNHNYIGIYALEAALDELLAIGSERAKQHAIRLSQMLTSGLADLGYTLISPTDPASMSHIVVFRPVNAAIGHVRERLDRSSVRYTARGECLRMSFHIYNDQSDVARVLEVLSSI